MEDKTGYERGYHAGYKAGLKTLTDTEAYKKGYKDALELIQSLAMVKLAQERKRGNKNGNNN